MSYPDIKRGSTDKTIDVFIQDSSSTTGAGLTGLVFNSAGLVCYYRRGATGSATALTLATQTVGGAHSDGGFVEISSANMPGHYRLDLSDAVIAAGVDVVTIALKGATNMAPCNVRIPLVDHDPQLDTAAILVDTGTTLQGEVDGIQADTEDIQSRLPAALTADGNIKADTLRVGGTLQTAGDIPALITTVDTVVDAILLDTGTDGVVVAASSKTGYSLASTGMDIVVLPAAVLAQINAEADSAIVTYGLDHLVFTSVVGADIADNSIIARLASKSATADWDSFVNTTDSLQAISDQVTEGGGGSGDATLDNQAKILAIIQADVSEC